MTLINQNNFIHFPDQYYKPSYRIGPFKTSDIALCHEGGNHFIARDFFNDFIDSKNWQYTISGKEAINIALSELNLTQKDCVSVLTSSGNKYIASCVTNEIEKFCSWSRDIKSNTAAIFVNHEFGYPHRNLADLKKYNLPIIEDACHSFFANTNKEDIGLIGDFIIYSLPKIFPMQLGGLIFFDKKYEKIPQKTINNNERNYIENIISSSIKNIEAMKSKRLENYTALKILFASLGCKPWFNKLKNDVPGVFLFSVPGNFDLSALKEHVISHGIECSIFYDERAFFIPCHHRLQHDDLKYFFSVFEVFFQKNL
jgi:hypothetical protein